MKSTNLISKSGLACITAGFVSLTAQSAHSALILQYDSITDSGGNNSGFGQLSTFNVDSTFVSAPLSFIGTATAADSTPVQGLGSGAAVNGGAVNQGGTVSVGTGDDVVFSINSSGGLTGSTLDSLTNGNFIFFTFTAAQDFNLTQLSVISDPNTAGGNNPAREGARTAGAFVSVDGGTTFEQFGSDFTQNNAGLRTNTFNQTVSLSSGDTVQVAFAFTNEVGAAGFQSGTRIGSISVEGVAIPEPTSSTLLISSMGLLLLRRRR